MAMGRRNKTEQEANQKERLIGHVSSAAKAGQSREKQIERESMREKERARAGS